jgi:hypothetical protein
MLRCSELWHQSGSRKDQEQSVDVHPKCSVLLFTSVKTSDPSEVSCCSISLISLQHVVPRLSSAVETEAVWMYRPVAMVIGTAVMQAMRRIVV